MKPEPQDRLDLSTGPAILFLFGLAGSGKNYVARLIVRLAGYHHYDADADITDEMRQALEEGRPFTDEMRDRFFQILADRIVELHKVHPRLVVTQAVYKQRHRDYLLSRIPDMEFIHIQADDAVIKQRLAQRKHGVDRNTAAILRPDFEPPDEKLKCVVNDGDEAHLIRQLHALY